jgi:hypothetical protein
VVLLNLLTVKSELFFAGVVLLNLLTVKSELFFAGVG